MSSDYECFNEKDSPLLEEFKVSDEDMEEVYQAYDDMYRITPKMELIINKCFPIGSKIRKEVDDYLFNDCLQSVWNYEMVDEPIGDSQDESRDYSKIKTTWVNQFVGYCEDDYHGTVCISANNGRYFKFDYRC